MASRLMKLREQWKSCSEKMQDVHEAILALGDNGLEGEEVKAKRDELTAEYERLQGKLAETEQDIKREEQSQERERFLEVVRDDNELTSQSKAAMAGNRNVGNSREAYENDPKCGFATPREFLLSVMDTAKRGRIVDGRLQGLVIPAEAVGSDEQSTFADPYGGFLLPTGFMPDLLSVPAEVDPIAGRTTPVPMETARVEIPARVDKNHTNSVSGGLRVYRRAEGDTVSASRMEFEQVALEAHCLFGLVYSTEELLSRSPLSFIALLEAGFKDEFAAKLVDERLNGSGVGMYEGVMNAPCKISVPKETGQTKDTIVYENVIKMRARCWRYGQAIWLANHNTLPELMKLSHAVGTGGVPVWQPSAREGEPEMLLGRPIYFTEYCDTVGDEGDILLGNWSQYLEGTLTPMKQAESIHVRFINHERTFKFWTENDGRAWWRAALSPKNGADTLSPFVTLAARA